MYHVRVLHGEPVVFRLFLGKNVAALGRLVNRYILATLGIIATAGGWRRFPLCRYMLAILGENVRARNFFNPRLVHLGHFGRKCLGSEFFIFGQYIVALSNDKVLAANFSSSACTFWAFWAKTYRLGVLYPRPVHFSHFGRKCTGWGFYILRLYILAIWGKNVPAGSFWFSGGTLWPVCEKIWRPAVFYSQLVHFGQFGRKCTGWGLFVLSRDTFGNLGPKCTGWEFFILSG